jgi:hypothetical protein
LSSRLLTAYSDATITQFKKAMVFSPATLERIAARWKAAGLPD